MRTLKCVFCRAEVKECRCGSCNLACNLELHLKNWHNITVEEELVKAVKAARDKEDEAEEKAVSAARDREEEEELSTDDSGGTGTESSEPEEVEEEKENEAGKTDDAEEEGETGTTDRGGVVAEASGLEKAVKAARNVRGETEEVTEKTDEMEMTEEVEEEAEMNTRDDGDAVT